MDSFTKKFSKYENCAPPGVRLPKINIDDKYYKELNISKDTSNFDFLRKLCHKGVKDRKIDGLSNKNEYFETEP